MNSCIICDEIINGSNSVFFKTYLRDDYFKAGLRDRILFKNSHFAILPSVGPISSCHLLIIPLQHVNCFAQLDNNILTSAQILIGQVLDSVTKIFGRSMAFEHGTFSEQLKGSASCDHAHLHILACNLPLEEELQKRGFLFRQIATTNDLKKQSESKHPYFYIHVNGRSWIMDDIVCHPQYLRILAANLLGEPEHAIWQNNLGIEQMIATNKLFKDEFKKLK